MARKQARWEPVESRTLEPIFRGCWECGRPRWVAYHNRRTVAMLNGLVRLRLVVRRCVNRACPRYPGTSSRIGPRRRAAGPCRTASSALT